VYLWHLFLIKPLAALSIVICLVTIFACFKLERKRPQLKSDRFMIAFLGLLAIYQGMRILESAGVLSLSIGGKFDDAIELLIATFYMIASMLLRFSSVNRMDADSALRLVRAAPPRLSKSVEPSSRDLVFKAGSPALDSLTWAMPRLTDGAFKLFAWFCVQADPAGRAVLQDRDIQLRMKRSLSELESYYLEIERNGAATIRRAAGQLEIELGQGRNVGPSLTQLSAAVSSLPVPELRS
jgi:hypothetical protein